MKIIRRSAFSMQLRVDAQEELTRIALNLGCTVGEVVESLVIQVKAQHDKKHGDPECQ